MSLSFNSVLESVGPLIEAGAALHWLRPREKSPIERDWSDKPRATLDQLRRTHVRNANIGIRLGEPSETVAGYIHLIDLDIRDPEKAPEAIEYLREIWPDFALFPAVISGSGGESRHYYFVTSKPFRSKKLARSPGFKMVWDKKKQREVKKHDWEIELFGTGKQAVLPPSIHPDTGQPYRWITEPDLRGLLLGDGPILDAAVVEGWGVRVDDRTGDEEDPDDLLGIVVQEPLGLERDEIERILADLPDWWVSDREKWYQVGMALHHEFRGSQEGFDLWCDWSQGDPEKFDEDDQHRVWKSFKGNKRPVRMPTLIQAAKLNRFEREHGDLTADTSDDFGRGATGDDFEDLLAEPDDALLDLLGEPKSPPATLRDSTAINAGEPDLDQIMPKPEVAENWQQLLDLNDEGHPKTTLHNVSLIVANDPRLAGVIGYNEFRQDISQMREPARMSRKRERPKPVKQLEGPLWVLADPINGDSFTDSHDNQIRDVLEAPTTQGGYGIKVSDRDLKAAIDKAARMNPYHPLRYLLNRFADEWDGEQRAERLFIKYLGCPDTPYFRAAARLMLLGAVVRAYEPGHKFDFVVILEGAQGKRKSTFIEVLGLHWKGDLSADFHNTKDMVESMQGVWIAEIPELQGFSRADVTQLKAFLTKLADRVRLAYERRARDFPRQCIFIGSTNDKSYLRDSTGGRRFWPIEVGIEGDIDTDGLKAEIGQIWGEVVHMYREMRKAQPFGTLPLYLADDDARREAEELQESRRVEAPEDQWRGQIEEWLNTPLHAEFEDKDGEPPRYRNQTCIKEIWCEITGRDAASLTRQDSNIIGAALERIPGWKKVGPRKFKDYGSQKAFVRISEIPGN